MDWDFKTTERLSNKTRCKPSESVSVLLFYRLNAIQFDNYGKFDTPRISIFLNLNHRGQNILKCTFASIILYRYFIVLLIDVKMF